MSITSRVPGSARPVWLPPVVSIATLAGLFASAVAGLIMLALGLYTGNHVLR